MKKKKNNNIYKFTAFGSKITIEMINLDWDQLTFNAKMVTNGKTQTFEHLNIFRDYGAHCLEYWVDQFILCTWITDEERIYDELNFEWVNGFKTHDFLKANKKFFIDTIFEAHTNMCLAEEYFQELKAAFNK